MLLLTTLLPTIDSSNTEIEKLSFIITHKTLYQYWITLIYVLFGLVLVPLTIAIRMLSNHTNDFWANVSPVFGFIWAGLVIASGMITTVGIDAVAKTYIDDQTRALSSWQTIQVIHHGIGGGIEVVGGLWVILVSFVGLRNSLLSKPLNYFGLLVGTVGSLTLIPALKDLGAVFGLTQIVWFIWIGIEMLRKASAQKPPTS